MAVGADVLMGMSASSRHVVDVPPGMVGPTRGRGRDSRGGRLGRCLPKGVVVVRGSQ